MDIEIAKRAITYTRAIAEFAATTAAMNANALKRAGLLSDEELATIHRSLDVPEPYGDENGAALVEALRGVLRASDPKRPAE